MRKKPRARGSVLLGLILIVLGLVAFKFVRDYLDYDYYLNKNIDYCKSFFSGTGKIRDITNELAVHSEDDISVIIKKDKTVHIQFGKIELKFKNVDDLCSDEMVERLKSIYLFPKMKKDVLTIKFRDKDVNVWYQE